MVAILIFRSRDVGRDIKKFGIDTLYQQRKLRTSSFSPWWLFPRPSRAAHVAPLLVNFFNHFVLLPLNRLLHHSSLCQTDGVELKSKQSYKQGDAKADHLTTIPWAFDHAQTTNGLTRTLYFHARITVKLPTRDSYFHGDGMIKAEQALVQPKNFGLCEDFWRVSHDIT